MSQALGSGASPNDLRHSSGRSEAQTGRAFLSADEQQELVQRRSRVDARQDLPVIFPLPEEDTRRWVDAVVRPGPEVVEAAERWSNADDMMEYLIRPGSMQALMASGVDVAAKYSSLKSRQRQGRQPWGVWQAWQNASTAAAAQPAGAEARFPAAVGPASAETGASPVSPAKGGGPVVIPLGSFRGSRGAPSSAAFASSAQATPNSHGTPVQPNLPGTGPVVLPLGHYPGSRGAAPRTPEPRQ